ncbi:MAG: CBS domain-containing protein [Proteobacteria bacterium]|nr:CBS domain-containing protein [Pseudomonadota bacterium]
MDVASILRIKGSSVATAPPEATITDIAAKLKEEKIGALVVSDDGLKVLGIISERDIVRGLADHGLDLLEKRAEELMTAEVMTCTPNDTTGDLMAVMSEKRIRHIPVTENGELCGIVSIGDVVKDRLDEIEREANALRAYVTKA